MKYSRKLTLTFALAFAMVAAVVSAQNSPADYVDPHNEARGAVSVEPVTWNATLAAYAQNYAEQRRGDCQLKHSTGSSYGENIFGGRRSGAIWTAADAVFAWTNEEEYYDNTTNTCTAGNVCEHYTQVVWRASTSIGCGHVVCDSNDGVFIICNYSPPGNVPGQRPY